MIFEHLPFADHECVMAYSDPRAGLRAIIAIHSTALGPAAGGCRMWPYADSALALADVLRLSAAMSYKNALAGLPLGGGKSVIIGDPRRAATPALLAAFGRCVEELNGRYWTAEDVGIGIEEVEELAKSTQYVFGRRGGRMRTGDPSPFTALGCFHGIHAAVAHKLGRTDLAGIRVAVQGLGSVGYELCKLLHAAGARLVVTDVSSSAMARVAHDFSAMTVDPEVIFDQDVDIFSPCALGGVLNDGTIARLRAKVVAGAANNQLMSPRHGTALAHRGILYAPDYVVNAGGMHNASGDILGRYQVTDVTRRISGIYALCMDIFERAAREQRCPEEVADEMARERLSAARPAA